MAKSFTSKKSLRILTIASKFAGLALSAIVGFFTIQHFSDQQKSTVPTFPAIDKICGTTVLGSNNTVIDNNSNATFNCVSKASAR
jgi:hypothetical protein